MHYQIMMHSLTAKASNLTSVLYIHIILEHESMVLRCEMSFTTCFAPKMEKLDSWSITTKQNFRFSQ